MREKESSTRNLEVPTRRSDHFSRSAVASVLGKLLNPVKRDERSPKQRWLSLVAARAIKQRPSYAQVIAEYLPTPAEENLLEHLSIGEMSACYEALLATLDRNSRKESGQFFTPDDAAQFMAAQSKNFPDGVWLDPCCGVGNLSWHLVAAQDEPSKFIQESLVLSDRDDVALKSAVALIAAEFGDPDEPQALLALSRRAECKDFLEAGPVVEHDFVICNPPYAATSKEPRFRTANCRELYAYFWEKIALSSRGYVVVTPASYMSAPKYSPLRKLLEAESRGGRVYVFDNVPDTLFRGFKYGSKNTSKTNFVRAAVTVAAPKHADWQTTPILRWQATERKAMFEQAYLLLRSRRTGPHGEWAKLLPGVLDAWDILSNSRSTLNDIIVPHPTLHRLDVALTPRYYISASYRELVRGSKTTLYFESSADRDMAAIVLNSSLPYLWWRSLDGGVTLPLRVLLSTPIPSSVVPSDELTEAIKESETTSLVVKMNAGSPNENMKHDFNLVRALNAAVIPGDPDLSLLYSNSMFPLSSSHR